jgi:hypothetical protein
MKPPVEALSLASRLVYAPPQCIGAPVLLVAASTLRSLGSPTPLNCQTKIVDHPLKREAAWHGVFHGGFIREFLEGFTEDPASGDQRLLS